MEKYTEYKNLVESYNHPKKGRLPFLTEWVTSLGEDDIKLLDSLLKAIPSLYGVRPRRAELIHVKYLFIQLKRALGRDKDFEVALGSVLRMTREQLKSSYRVVEGGASTSTVASAVNEVMWWVKDDHKDD